MRQDRLQYNLNARESKSLCKEMESLVAELSGVPDLIKPNLYNVLLEELVKVQNRLDVLWDEQIKLYPKVYGKEQI